LVVDDVELNRRIASKALQKLPFSPQVIEAKDGFEALQMVKSQKPDLIVLDLMMPGISGFDVCRQIREDVETAFIPVIMLTASTMEENRTEGFLTGTDDYMTKPFSIPDLHARVTRLFRRTYGV
jgi:CheY-like chemotaxis protein